MSAPSSWQSDLRQLQELFRAGYSGYPPLSVCRVAGKVPGDLDRKAIDPYWPVLLSGHGSPWRKVLTLAFRADPPREPEQYPVYDCYWAPRLEPDPAPVERRFFELGAGAAEVLAEAGRLGYQIGRSRPTHAGQGHHWLDFLFRLAWEGNSRVLQAPRFRLHYKTEEDSYLVVEWHEEMDDNPCMIHSTIRFRDVNPAYASEPWGGDIWREAEVNPQAKLAFPHRFISYLEDLFQASASAIDLLLREPAPAVGASIQGGIMASETTLQATEQAARAPLSGLRPHGTLSGLIRQFERDSALFKGECKGEEGITPAIGYWLGYPLFVEAIECMPQTTPEDKYHATSTLSTTHIDAVWCLMRHVERLQLDPSPLWEEGRVCREIFSTRNLDQSSARQGVHGLWPDCLGRTRYELPRSMQGAIRDGEAVFMRLVTLLGLGDAELERIRRGIRDAGADGPLGNRRFRLDGQERDFGRARNRYLLFECLWPPSGGPRDIDAIVKHVWGTDTEGKERALNKLAQDLTRQLQIDWGHRLEVEYLAGSQQYQLVRLPS